jgi:hypothetical protein
MSRPVKVTIPHSLGKEECQRRIDEGFGRLQQQMTGGIGMLIAFNRQWEGDRLNFEGGGLGQKLTRRLDVGSDSVDLELDLPEVLAAIADKIAGRVRAEGQKLLEKKP